MKTLLKHIIITGASGGIGRALAEYYAAPEVMLSLCARNADKLETVAAFCRARQATVHAKILDVTDREAMRLWLLERDEECPVDLVIANAGISGGTGGMFNGETEAQIRNIFSINLDGVLNTVQPLQPRMIERGHGQIALMSSLAGYRGWPGAPAYCGSKAAVRVYGESLRGALAKTGVKVNVICPGFVRSSMTEANNFPMPFLMDTKKAAALISRKLACNKGRIAFPWPAAFFVWLFMALPDAFMQKVLGFMPEKPHLQP
ncbi:MAG: SDR family NAD(P)-dependent oxidoreductase [Alphaproteobacteria bacterium]|nr:SDR family NAD(P)-dependent oxidoreductase [Alphaproteobacteria bacterium]